MTNNSDGKDTEALARAWLGLNDTQRREFETLTNDPSKLPEAAGEAADQWRAFTMADAYQERPPVEYIVPGLFALPSLNIPFGAPGSLKSFLMADQAVCTAAGLPWLPPAPWLGSDANVRAFPTRQAPVIWVDFDNGRRRTLDRFAALGRAHKIPRDCDQLHFYSMPKPWLDASDEASIGSLALRIQRTGARLVVVDNLGVVTGNAEENSGEMASVMSGFRQLAEDSGAAIVLIHHQRKGNGLTGRAGDNLRGHSSIEASLDLALAIEREEYSETVTIKATKVRGADVLPFSAYFTSENHPSRPDELQSACFYGVATDDQKSGAAIERAILETLENGEPMNKTDLVKAVKEVLPEIGINRIRPRIEKMAGEKALKVEPGKRSNEHYYRKP